MRLLLLALVAAPAVHAQSARLGLTCVGSQTGQTIHFQYRFGTSGSWTDSDVRHQYWRPLTHWYDYAGENRGPTLYVRFDDDMTSRSNVVTVRLEQFAARENECRLGKQYNFRQYGNRLALEMEN